MANNGGLRDDKERVCICLNKNMHRWIKNFCDKNGISFSNWVTLQIEKEHEKSK